jgi:hypothetical protein
MHRDLLSIELFLAALRCARGWRPEHVVPIAMMHPGVYRPRARA